MPKAETEFGAPVPTEEYEFFKENFPQYGAVKWFINNCLIEFNSKVRENPTSKEMIVESIEEMAKVNRILGRTAQPT